MERRIELDWLRGLMLVLMTTTHLPTWYSAHWGQPFGFVSAAEGFVFLSAFLVGTVYGNIASTQGVAAMRSRVWRRTGAIYLAHVALLLFLLWVLVPIAVARSAHPITDLASFYLARPRAALAGGLLLAYDPPLLDILPMYVLFMAASPLLIVAARRHGCAAVLVPSVVLWLLAQLGFGEAIYGALENCGWPVPYRETGAFSWLAWQLMWVLGLTAGVASLAPRARIALGPRTFALAAAVAVGACVWRHAAGQSPDAPAWVLAGLDKWHLGALRLLDFGALLVLVIGARDALRASAERSPLTLLGRASLTVFCAHLVVCLTALALVADVAPATLRWEDTLLLAATMGALLLIARAIDRRRSGRRAARRVPAVAALSLPRAAPARTAR